MGDERKVVLSMRVVSDLPERLRQVAALEGIHPTVLAAELLDEALATIEDLYAVGVARTVMVSVAEVHRAVDQAIDQLAGKRTPLGPRKGS